jgi:hypothetical protein
VLDVLKTVIFGNQSTISINSSSKELKEVVQKVLDAVVLGDLLHEDW